MVSRFTQTKNHSAPTDFDCPAFSPSAKVQNCPLAGLGSRQMPKPIEAQDLTIELALFHWIKCLPTQISLAEASLCRDSEPYDAP
jgi:hypothetical protein